MSKRKKSSGVMGGCGFALATTLFGCVLLVLNGGVVAAVYFALAANGPEIMRHPGLSQLVLYLGPIILLYLEWSLTDFAGRHSGQTETSAVPAEGTIASRDTDI